MEVGKIIAAVGGALLVIGLLLMLLPKGSNPFGWFGKLPGDISYENGNTSVFAPIASMLAISIALSGVLWVIQKLFR